MPKTRPPYDPEFRRRILELASSGRSVKSLAKEFGCTEQSIRNWQRQAGQQPTEATVSLNPEEKEELAQLRREVRVLREERDILKNPPARLGHLLRQKLPAPYVDAPGGAAVCFLVTYEPVKKHGPGMAADLRVVTPSGRSRLGK